MNYNNGTIEIDLAARSALYDELTDDIPAEIINEQLEQAVFDQLSGLYDNKDELMQQLAQQ